MSDAPVISFETVRRIALEIGWDDVGVTEARIPQEDIDAYEEWLKNRFQGNLDYMENRIRCDPSLIFPAAKTAVLFVTYYKQEKLPFEKGSGLVASYARGRDYHRLHRKRLKRFILRLEELTEKKEIAKGFSDSTPILEKALAVKAGLGWFGKNTLLIHRKFGTFFLLSGVLTSIEISSPVLSFFPGRVARCGTCTRCLDACPTQALVSPYKLDANRCLSYHLIESKHPLPEEIRKKNPGYAFGCDICQDVCPHNLRTPLSPHLEFQDTGSTGPYLSPENFPEIERNPEILFGTPLQRRGVSGLKHTLESLSLPDEK